MALTLLSQRLGRQALRGSLSLYFLVVEGAGVAGYGFAGLLTAERLALIGVAALPVLLAFGVAALIHRRMNEGCVSQGGYRYDICNQRDCAG